MRILHDKTEKTERHDRFQFIRCSGCRHWTENEEKNDAEESRGACAKLAIAYNELGDGYTHATTPANFGCVLFQEPYWILEVPDETRPDRVRKEHVNNPIGCCDKCGSEVYHDPDCIHMKGETNEQQ